MPWPLLAAIPGIIGAIGGGAGAAGAAGGIAGAAGAGAGAAGAGGAAAGGIGGAMGGAGGMGGMMGKAGNIMGMMGGGGGGGQQQGQQQGGGGMMKGIMDLGKMPMKHIDGAADDMIGMLKAQFGAGITPELIDYMKKAQGGGQAIGGGQAAEAAGSLNLPQNFMQAPQAPVGAESLTAGGLAPQAAAPVQAPPTDTFAQTMGQPMPGQEPMPTLPNQGTDPSMTSQVATSQNPNDKATLNSPKSGGALNPLGSVTGALANNKGQYQTDEQGITKVTETSDIMGDAMGKAKKGDILGATIGAATAVVGQQSQMRRQRRELAQQASEQERAQKKTSVYNDPNSVYYAAKDGAAIDPKRLPSLANQNNNLNSKGSLASLAFQHGGGTLEKTVMGEAEGMVEEVPRYVEKGKSHHYNPNAFLDNMGRQEGKPVQTYRRTVGDFAYDILHPNKPAKVSMRFNTGGSTKEPKPTYNLGGMLKGILPFKDGGGNSYSTEMGRNSLKTRM